MEKEYRKKNIKKVKEWNKTWNKNNKERKKKHRLSNLGKYREAAKRDRIKFPLKIKARREAQQIKISIIQLCEKCNENPAIERHHEDYSKPLEVELLCKDCHNLLPKRIINEGGILA